MRFVISTVALAAFLLHSLFGCAFHAHADEETRCATESVFEKTNCEHGHDHQDSLESPTSPCDHSDSRSHEADCVFAATAKTQTLSATAFELQPSLSTAVFEPAVVLPDNANRLAVGNFYRGALRSHLAKSVQLN